MAVKKKLTEVFKTVSEQLNNTPAMAKSSYVHPEVIDGWLSSLGVELSGFTKGIELDKLIGNVSKEDEEDVEEYPLPDWWEDEEDIEKGVKANLGEIRVWGGKRMKKVAPGEWERVDEAREQMDNFLYSLKYEYVIDFDKKNLQVFKNFYRNYPNELLGDLFPSKVIGALSNNLPESLVERLSKCRFSLVGSSRFDDESGGYWVGAYRFNEIYLNKEVYSEFRGDYYGQDQLLKVNLHELGHKLYEDDIIDADFVIDLWKTGERVTSQAKVDYEENFCEAFAAVLMALGDQGDREDNYDLNLLKEECPETCSLILKKIKEL